MHENLIDPCVLTVSSVSFLNEHQIQWHQFLNLAVVGRVAREGQSGKPGYARLIFGESKSVECHVAKRRSLWYNFYVAKY